MKKAKARLLATILALLLGFILTGCSTIRTFVQAGISGLPYWVYNPQFGLASGATAFVGQGKAETARQAELFAYSDIISQLSDYLGVELGQEQYKELSVLGTIANLGLTVSNTEETSLEGQAVVYVLAVADTQALEAASSDEVKKRNELSKSIEQLILEGDGYIRQGQDLKGVSSYLQSMVLSYGQDYIDEEYAYGTIAAEIEEVLNSVNITLLSKNAKTAETIVQVLRKTSLFPSRVDAAEIKASYQAIDVTGGIYDDSFVYSTDSNGLISYSPLNFTMVRKGSVVFSFDLDTELEALLSTDEQTVNKLKALIQSKSVTFEYDKEYSLGSIAIAVLEHDANGYVTDNKTTTDYLVYCLNVDGADAQAYYALSDQEEDVLYDYVQTRGSCNCLLVCRFGQTETITSSNGIFVTVEGTATLYTTNLRDKNRVLYESDIIYATGSAETSQEAIKQAYVKLADIVHSLLKDAYV